MTEEERDVLLGRLDERTKIMSEDISEFKKIVSVVEKAVTDIQWLKKAGASATALVSGIAAIVAYLKH